MTSIAYIIATYAGADHTSNGVLSNDVLHLQMNQLFKLLDYNHSMITDVVIVCPKVRGTELKGYYRFDEWKEKFKKYPNTNLTILDYKGNNQYHSYDQWIQGMMAVDTDYYIFIEDDYYIEVRPHVDTELVQLYTQSFPNNIGYLCTLTDDVMHDYHAAISNGMVSADTLKVFDNPLEKFYNVRTQTYPQLMFSDLFLQHNIPIVDYADTYRVYFWNSPTNELRDMSRPKTTTQNHVFVPIQVLKK